MDAIVTPLMDFGLPTPQPDADIRDASCIIGHPKRTLPCQQHFENSTKMQHRYDCLRRSSRFE
jgi:hypothetical protein